MRAVLRVALGCLFKGLSKRVEIIERANVYIRGGVKIMNNYRARLLSFLHQLYTVMWSNRC